MFKGTDIKPFENKIWLASPTMHALIHSGASISNIKELGEHLHSYVDACILEIVPMNYWIFWLEKKKVNKV